ncbi:hypothetical protein [Cryobacterium sp. Y29]|uniref:hypothetical protein n=1 Tax=Cryobacterium sp. Y29 TaxID=2048285 RepID=UPI0011B02086|nr:hypothetical protein [Cryobacterium sp. Y29]
MSRSHVYAPAADLTPDTKSGRITSLPAQTLELLRRRHEVLRESTTLLKEGLSATEIADYLGHENPFMTQDVHMNAIKGSKRAAEVMGQRPDGLI